MKLNYKFKDKNSVLNQTPTLLSFMTGNQNVGGLSNTVSFLKNIMMDKIRKKAADKIFN